MNKNYCCLVVDGIVQQIIVAEYDWVLKNLEGNWFDLGGEPLAVGVGYIHDDVNNTFTLPVIPE